MREILFRGKRLDNGKWIEGCLINLDEDSGHVLIVPLYHHASTMSVSRIIEYTSAYVNPKTVGQFTGLTDKNGTKIFEGDILEYNDGYDYFKGEVVFENGAFGVGSYEVIGFSSGCCDNFADVWQLFWNQEVTDEPELYYCKLIGNIHDNPELLKGE